MAEQYWYPGGLADTSFTSGPSTDGWQPHNFIYGASIVVGGSAGTATLIGVRSESSVVATKAIKIGLYDSSGTLLAQGTATSQINVSWEDAAISVSVTPGTYIVMVSAVDTFVNYYYNTGGNGIGETFDYASSMPASISTTADEASLRYGVRVYVVEDAVAPRFILGTH